MELFRWRGRGRLVVRWERAHDNPRRQRLPVHEQVRRHMVEEVGAGRMTVEAAASRYERFLARHEGA